MSQQVGPSTEAYPCPPGLTNQVLALTEGRDVTDGPDVLVEELRQVKVRNIFLEYFPMPGFAHLPPSQAIMHGNLVSMRFGFETPVLGQTGIRMAIVPTDDYAEDTVRARADFNEAKVVLIPLNYTVVEPEVVRVFQVCIRRDRPFEQFLRPIYNYGYNEFMFTLTERGPRGFRDVVSHILKKYHSLGLLVSIICAQNVCSPFIIINELTQALGMRFAHGHAKVVGIETGLIHTAGLTIDPYLPYLGTPRLEHLKTLIPEMKSDGSLQEWRAPTADDPAWPGPEQQAALLGEPVAGDHSDQLVVYVEEPEPAQDSENVDPFGTQNWPANGPAAPNLPPNMTESHYSFWVLLPEYEGATELVEVDQDDDNTDVFERVDSYSPEDWTDDAPQNPLPPRGGSAGFCNLFRGAAQPMAMLPESEADVEMQDA